METMPNTGLVIRDDLQVLAWEGDTTIEAFLTWEQAAVLGARLSHYARAHKARAEAAALEAECDRYRARPLTVRIPESDQ